MGLYRIADRVFDLRPSYPYTRNLCADYEIFTTEAADYTVSVTPSEIDAERKGEEKYSDEYLESLAVYRKITELLKKEDCFLFHAAVISFDSKAYAFTAKSGTGKTTHVRLWKKVFGDRVTFINGDKPIIRRERVGDTYKFYAYGTPWCGKENLNTNTKAELFGICLLERGMENEIIPAKEEAIPFLMGQLNLNFDKNELTRTLSMLDSLVTSLPVYRLRCNISEEAARLACSYMCKEK